ncbi:MAG: DUF6263 family protein [Proteobacteria bacterium]|nr:DUF6263 family protein [Pseudomonadota bacterium]
MMWRISLVIVLAACGGKPAPPPPIVETNVELVGRGAAPLTTLRYKLAKGRTTRLDVAVTSVMLERKSPQVTTTMSFVADDVLADGRVVLRSTVEKTVGVMPDGTTPVPAELVNFFEGTQIAGTLSAVGTLSETKVIPGPHKLPSADLETELAQLPKMFEQAAIALPNAPVGVGASWRTRKSIDENGVKVTAVSTMTITAIDGDKLSFTRATQLSGPDQTITRDGLNVALSQITGSGHGKGTIDLATFEITLDSEDAYQAKVRDKRTPTAPEEPMAVSMMMSMAPTK